MAGQLRSHLTCAEGKKRHQRITVLIYNSRDGEGPLGLKQTDAPFRGGPLGRNQVLPETEPHEGLNRNNDSAAKCFPTRYFRQRMQLVAAFR